MLAIHPKWTFPPIAFIILAVLGVLTNSAALLNLIQRHTLHTAFDITVMHLFTQNILASGIQYGLAGAAALYPGSWRLGKPACDLSLLNQLMLTAALANTHSLIALNRAWAILHPWSYRNYNTKRAAWFTCLGFWTYLLLLAFPYWLRDLLYFREARTLLVFLKVGTRTRRGRATGNYICMFNSKAQPRYGEYISIWVYSMPIAVVLVMFVLVAVKKPGGRKQPDNTHGPGRWANRVGVTGTSGSVSNSEPARWRAESSTSHWPVTPITFMTPAVILYPGLWRLAKKAWDLSLLNQIMLGAAIVNTHGLTALKRTWANRHPWSYRIYNTKRMA
ncbi:hypothetical protein BV898_19527 [Hypsibius exemplaris]|uniref:G-protein coupled receptors family 1 profile domain-containing protein n=1 Tax=Hypsibius exemplaris TaxID=2072580 RepID=A0A9X6NJ42_HYPEX|nr:hypothetical protein BV898_19527 [Hypsibius exemplaris]